MRIILGMVVAALCSLTFAQAPKEATTQPPNPPATQGANPFKAATRPAVDYITIDTEAWSATIRSDGSATIVHGAIGVYRCKAGAINWDALLKKVVAGSIERPPEVMAGQVTVKLIVADQQPANLLLKDINDLTDLFEQARQAAKSEKNPPSQFASAWGQHPPTPKSKQWDEPRNAPE